MEIIPICKLEIRKTYLGKSTNLLNKIYGVRKRAKLQLMSINETIVVSKNESFPAYFAFG